MKTAISLPKDIFEQAEKLARRTKKTRSRLYCDAIREYIARHTPDEITGSLDRVIDAVGESDDSFTVFASSHILEKTEW